MRYYAFGETRLSTGSMFTDRLYTGQRQIAELGIYHYNARFYSPKLGRFLSADTLMSGFASPQNLNRFSYVANNPARYTDPSGHMMAADTEGGGGSYTTSPIADYCATHPSVCSGGSGGSNDDGDDGGGGGNDPGDITYHFDTRDICNYVDCELGATLLGMLGTAADTAAFIVNGMWAFTADVALVLAGPEAYGAVVAGYNLVGSPTATIYGFGGLALWTGQGVLTGENHVAIDITLNSEMQLQEVSGSFSISQDTVFSVLNDTLSLAIKEPNVATIWSGVGAGYDVLRNPLAPALSSSPPIFPTVIQPSGSMTYNAQTGSFTGDLSLFTSP
jgi:RHS repeat-associated protein